MRSLHRPLRTRMLALAALLALGATSMPGGTALGATQAATSADWSSANDVFFITVDPGSDHSTASIIAIAVAEEFNKKLDIPTGAAERPWAIPEATWSIDDLAKKCRSDAHAIGGVVVAYFTDNATHFYLFWQSDTTTFAVFAQLFSCARNGADVTPTTVGIISALHNAGDTDWVVRRSQTSIPLLSLAGLIALTVHSATKSSSSSITTASIGAALVSQGLNKDIPGYSEPLRLRYGAKHVGDDLAAEIRWLCGGTDPRGITGPSPSEQLATLCRRIPLRL
jgi:hypothetical protein